MEVKVYTTQACPWCHRAKDFLRESGVEFKEIDVSADREAAMEMIKKSGQMGVPVIEINGKIIIGFNREAIEKELNC